jgi:hypothetical protein
LVITLRISPNGWAALCARAFRIGTASRQNFGTFGPSWQSNRPRLLPLNKQWLADRAIVSKATGNAKHFLFPPHFRPIPEAM